MAEVHCILYMGVQWWRCTIWGCSVLAEVLSAEVLSAEVLQYIINKPAFSPHLRFLLAVYSLSGFWGGIFTLLSIPLLLLYIYNFTNFYLLFISKFLINILVFTHVLLLR